MGTTSGSSFLILILYVRRWRWELLRLSDVLRRHAQWCTSSLTRSLEQLSTGETESCLRSEHRRPTPTTTSGSSFLILILYVRRWRWELLRQSAVLRRHTQWCTSSLERLSTGETENAS